MTLSVIWLTNVGDISTSYISLMVTVISREVIPLLYRDMT